MIRVPRAVGLVSTLLLSACVVGPNYRGAPKPARASGHFDAALQPVFDQSDAPAVWWRLYDDPVLDKLIGQAFVANTDIRVATANLRRARAVLQENRALRLPSTTTTASASYDRFGGTQSSGATVGAGGTAGGATKPSSPFTSEVYSLGFDLSYEIDFFGRVTRLIQAARADADALAAVRDTTRITVASETARAYADACSSAAQVLVARNSLEVQRQSFDLTDRLYTAGRGSPLDVARSRAQLETTRATLPAFVAARQGALYRLAVLTGQTPETLIPEAAACVKPPRLDRPLPIGDGAALLRRRPDIREADRTLAANVAQIGVAKADLFPRVTIGGSVTDSSFTVKGLGHSSSVAFSVGPALTWSFPNISVALARIKEAKAGAEGALATYDGVVLAALQETETALANYSGERDRNEALRAARDQSAEATRIVGLRYSAGAQSFIDVLDAQRTLANAEAELAASDAQLVTNQIAVFKALGGGWEQAPEPTPVAPPWTVAKPTSK